MKKFLLAATMAALCASAFGADKDLKIGVNANYEPFAYKTPDSKLAGFDIDIANAICEEIKRNCVFIEQPWDSLIPGLMAKKYDAAMSAISITPERLKQIDFSARYSNTPSQLLIRKDIAFDGLTSLKGKKIGVLKTSTQEKYALGELKPLGIEVIPYEEQDQVYLDLKAGRLDGTVADVVEVGGGFLGKPGSEGFQLVGDEMYTEKYFGIGMGVALRKGQSELKKDIDAAIATLRANGKYKAINDKYFKFDVYGK